MRGIIRSFILFIARTFGSKIVDQRTGRTVGRAFMIPWQGKIKIIGLEANVIPTFLPQKRLTYWKQEIGFATHPPPDFSKVRSIPLPADKEMKS